MRAMITVALLAGLGLAGCGGGGSRTSGDVYASRFASGPISRACLASDRRARSPELCGCVQAAANLELTNSDQRLAVSFYDDPHRGQEVRQSDRRRDRDFWDRYNDYIDRAERLCRGL